MIEQMSLVPNVAASVKRGTHTIYVIGSGSRIKVGRSKAWEERLRDLQTGSAETLVVRGLLHDVSASTETSIHVALAHQRLHGEWFRDDRETWSVLLHYGIERVVITRSSFDAESSRRVTSAEMWESWNAGVSINTISARRADLRGFGSATWGTRNELQVIRRVLETARDDPRTLRTLALAWIDAERERGMSAETLSRRWRTLSALLGAIKRRAAESGEHIAAELGPRPRAPQRPLVDGDVAALVRELADDGRHRDAAIIGLLGELGLRDHEVLALRARDVLALSASPPLAAALARVTRDARPQRAVIVGRGRSRDLSVATLYAIVEHLGTSVAALRRAAKGQ